MKKTHWVPGPWTVEYQEREDERDESVYFINATRQDKDWQKLSESGFGLCAVPDNPNQQIVTLICVEDWIEPYYSREKKKDRANAHLIAAAPELYEALEAILSERFSVKTVIKQARAAIAKARGEEPK